MSNPPDPEQPKPPAEAAPAPPSRPTPPPTARTRPVNGADPAAQTVRRERATTRSTGRGGNLLADGTRLVVGDLERGEVYTGTHPGDRVVRRVRPTEMGFKKLGPGHLEALPTASRPTTAAGRIFERLKRVIIGSPISTAEAAHERLNKVKALAVLSSDALSSVTYATEAILATLLMAGTAAFGYNVPIALGIALLIGIVVFSYRQTIYAYPKGGGSYIVSKDNLGTLPGLVAGASLSTGYILTVSVSIAAGVANLISLLATVGGVDLRNYRVEVALAAILVLVLLNLRGIRESGTIFSAPTYIFLLLMFGMIGLGLFQYFNGALSTVQNVPDVLPDGTQEVLGAAGLFLLLRAFASGCAALTGIEAISDGVAAFQKPEARNATITLTILGGLLGTMFLGISFLADEIKVRISETETVVSQLGRTIYGLGPIYTLFLIFTSLLLVLAANTAFADFPRLGYFLARDKFLPHQFAFRGDRLAFSFGIITLGVLAGLLIFLFSGETAALLPLYAIGVFTSFTLSQSGMVVRWWRRRPPGWAVSLAINAVGATTTALVTLILALSGFTRGAWMVLIIVPLMVLMFLRIHNHYTNVSRQISLADVDPIMGRAAERGGLIASAPMAMLPNEPTAAGIHPGQNEGLQPIEHLVIIPIAAMNQVTLRTIAYARSITKNVVGVHVASDEEAEEVAVLEQQWKQWVADVPLVVVESPYRSLTRPLLAYIDALHRQQADRVLTVVLPEFVPAHWWEHLLHNQTALRLKGALLGRPGIVVISVPYHLERRTAPAAA
jgi:amino acid transporter